MKDNTGTHKIAYSIREAAKATGLSPATIHKLCNNGSLTRRKVGKRTFILAEELESFFRDAPSGKYSPGDSPAGGRRVA